VPGGLSRRRRRQLDDGAAGARRRSPDTGRPPPRRARRASRAATTSNVPPRPTIPTAAGRAVLRRQGTRVACLFFRFRSFVRPLRSMLGLWKVRRGVSWDVMDRYITRLHCLFALYKLASTSSCQLSPSKKDNPAVI
jgi:hypothetical protein